MGRDGMLPSQVLVGEPADPHPDSSTPSWSPIVVALIAGFVPSDYLWDTVSIGTLMRLHPSSPSA